MLRPYVRSYWKLEGASGSPQDIFPDGSMEAVFHFGDRFAGQPRALLAGQMLEPARVQPTGKVEVWGIRFRPGGVAAFLAMPQNQLTNQIADLNDAWPELASVFERQSFADVDALLCGSIRVKFDAAAFGALQRLDASPDLELDALASSVNLSARQFRRRMAGVCGVGPKLAARLARFRTALGRSENATTLAELAADSGYADHAHMIRDFRQFAGMSPSETVCSLTGITRVFVRFSQDAGLV